MSRQRRHALSRVSDQAVPRPRVRDALLERIERNGLVHVVAPAGSGKTTAVAQAADALDRSIAWLTLEEWHRSPGKLLDELGHGLEPVAPGLQGEVRRARAEGAGASELAALIGSFLHRHHALLVVDDCHLLKDSPDAVAVLAALARRGPPGLHVVLVGRTTLPLVGVGVDANVPDATVGDELLRASAEEASEILGALGSSVDVADALEATNGWVAGIVFETWRARDLALLSEDPLRAYLEREVRPRMAKDVARLLVASSVFDLVDASRTEALGVEDPRAWILALREAGVPAVFAADGSVMRLHPRIRELLRDELLAGPAERRHSVLRAAAGALEREGELERSLAMYLETDDTASAGRLLPAVILDIVERQDVELADRYLAAVHLDPEPASVVLARLMLASIRASISAIEAVLEPLVADGHLSELIAEEPAIGVIACNALAANRLEMATDVLAMIPKGRAADVARLILSVAQDDPLAPIPQFAGDVLDVVVARALYSRGLLRELRAGRTTWAESAGTHALAGPEPSSSHPTSVPRFIHLLSRFTQAVASRGLEAARSCVAELEQEGSMIWGLLARAELAIRLERDPSLARIAIRDLRTRGTAGAVFFRELLTTWDGAAHLLDGEPEAAAEVLHEAVASMRRGDRTLALSRALVYLAEAEWRLGNEDASDQAADEAYEVARRQGSLRELMLSLADFPGVLSRRLDVERASESPWHSLGRALVHDARGPGVRVVGPVSAHLREFGEPALIVEGRRVVRPKIRKSLELLSYLLSSAKGSVSREEVLTALWNGRDDDSTRAYLRQALRHLRDVLPEGISVTAEGDSLSVEGAVTSESRELEAQLAEAARDPGDGRLGYLLEALELAGRDEFLEGSSDVRWVDDRRARLESVLTDVRLDAAELLLDADRHLRALALVDEALDADPLLERAWRLRMRALGLLGDYDGVTAAYAQCTSALGEIGLEPSSATSELARSLRR